MTSTEANTELITLLAAAGIKAISQVRPLQPDDIDHLLKTEAIRCIMTHCLHNQPRWLETAELTTLWPDDIQPKMINHDWQGWFEAAEWQTDQQETIIIFTHCYAPI